MYLGKNRVSLLKDSSVSQVSWQFTKPTPIKHDIYRASKGLGNYQLDLIGTTHIHRIQQQCTNKEFWMLISLPTTEEQPTAQM